MDLLSSQDTIRFFYKTRTANGFTINMDTTPMQIVDSTSTLWFSNATPFIKVYATETVTIEPNEGVRVSCKFDHCPDVINNNYFTRARPELLDNMIFVHNTVLSHDDLFPEGVRNTLTKTTKRTLQDSNKPTKYGVQMNRTVIALVYDHPSADLDAAIDIPESLLDDVPSMIYLATELATHPEIKTTQTFLMHLDNIISDAPPEPTTGYGDDFVQPPPPPSADPVQEIDIPPLPFPDTDNVIEDSSSYTLSEFQTLTSETLEGSPVLPVNEAPRFKTKDTSEEEKMDYTKDKTIISDEELLKKFDFSHISDPKTKTRLEEFILKHGDVFRPYVITGTKKPGEHTVKLKPNARPPNAPPYPE
ncbi:hypothetical protein HDU76_011529, partial [Blyttiomyces sp. JEL0837]